MDLIIAVPIIIALAEALKRAFKIERRFIPILSIVLGVLLFGIFTSIETQSLLEGLISGLTASGLYSGVKTTITG